MSTKSIEWLIEEFGIQLLRSHAQLKGKKMFHADSQQKAESDCLVFSAVNGDDKIPSLVGTTNLTIEYRSNTADPKRNDMIADAMNECFSAGYAKQGMTEVERQIDGLWIVDEKIESERPDTRNSRKRVLKVPFMSGGKK